MEAILSEMVPLAGICMIVLVVVIPIWLRTHYASQDRARLHETVRMMVDKGQPVSSEMLESLNSSRDVRYSDRERTGSSADIRRGVILIMVGLGLAALGFALGPVSGWEATGPVAGSGAFPGFIGLGFVVVGLLNRSKPKA
jgi:Domain of unknown function (DUF6249)